MTNLKSFRLASAISAIYPDIESRVRNNKKVVDEKGLWWELSACILSSQVPYSTAVAAADIIDELKLLQKKLSDPLAIHAEVFKVLSNPLIINGKEYKYRFADTRSMQLARGRVLVTQKSGSLTKLLENFRDAYEARLWLVKNMPGLGPKQASMFLRNIGVSYELAILDRHVLNYMSELGIYNEEDKFISGISKYFHYEEKLRKHANELNCNLGLLDWAIWIVMRVANQNKELLTA